MIKKLYKIILSVMLLALVILLAGCGGSKTVLVEQAKTTMATSATTKPDVATETTATPEATAMLETTATPQATVMPETAAAAPKEDATPERTSKVVLGYLLDGHCAKTGIDDETGKINVTKSPEKHTTSCLKLQMCMYEGIGITVKQSEGTFKYFAFDKTGAKMADDTIMMMTTRKFNNKISITGSLVDNTYTLSTIKEAK